MKNFLIAAILMLTLSACSDETADPMDQQTATSPAADTPVSDQHSRQTMCDDIYAKLEEESTGFIHPNLVASHRERRETYLAMCAEWHIPSPKPLWEDVVSDVVVVMLRDGDSIRVMVLSELDAENPELLAMVEDAPRVLLEDSRHDTWEAKVPVRLEDGEITNFMASAAWTLRGWQVCVGLNGDGFLDLGGSCGILGGKTPDGRWIGLSEGQAAATWPYSLTAPSPVCSFTRGTC